MTNDKLRVGQTRLSPEQRAERARNAAAARWSNTTDRVAATEPMRAAQQTKWEREVDPDGVLPADTRAKLARSAGDAHRAHCRYLALQAKHDEAVAAVRAEYAGRFA